MTEVRPPLIQNKILAALPKAEYDQLIEHLTPIKLELGDKLYKSDERIKYVYFISTGVVSLVAYMKDGRGVEVGLVGNEGMVGLSIVLGDDRSSNEAIVQIADGALRMDANKLREALKQNSRLLALLLRSTVAMLQQVSQTAACNGSHTVAERLARWLLMCHDRVDGNELRLTQEFIAQMLGTRRSGVSEAAIQLQGEGLIQYSRGNIMILDRQGLEEFGCECYATVKAEADRLFKQ